MRSRRAGELGARVGLPAVLAIAGAACLIVGHASGATAAIGVVLLGVALMVILIDWLYRLAIESNRDREREERAREYFDRTGRWPRDDREEL